MSKMRVSELRSLLGNFMDDDYVVLLDSGTDRFLYPTAHLQTFVNVAGESPKISHEGGVDFWTCALLVGEGAPVEPPADAGSEEA